MLSQHKQNLRFHLFGIILIITQFLNLVIYNLGSDDTAYFIAALFFSFLYFSNLKGNTKDNFAVLFLIFYIWISTMAGAAFHLLGDDYTTIQYKALASFSGKLYFILFVSAWLISLFKKNRLSYRNILLEQQRPFKKSFLRFVFLFLFLLSIICGILGVQKMGMETTQLPFHLNGVIKMIKNIAPYLFMLIIVKNIENKKQRYWFFLLVALWGILESLVTFSKSGLMNAFLPIIIYYVLSLKKMDKSVMRAIALVVVLFVLLYPILGDIRTVASSGIKREDAIKIALENQQEKKDGSLISIYKRVFSAGEHYMRDMFFVNPSNFFDFSRISTILGIGGGSARYHTIVVDGFSPDAIHSSGTTGLTDALLLGGYGLCYVTLVLLVFAAFFIDSNTIKKNICLRVFLIITFTEIVRTRTYSYFFDGVAIPTLTSNVLILFIILKTYKSAKILYSK